MTLSLARLQKFAAAQLETPVAGLVLESHLPFAQFKPLN